MRTSDIAIVGERDAVLCLKAVGVEVIPAADGAEAADRLREAIDRGFKVVFLTETLAGALGDRLRELPLGPRQSVVLIPGPRGEPSLGQAHLREVVRRAVGADIFVQGSETGGSRKDESERR